MALCVRRTIVNTDSERSRTGPCRWIVLSSSQRNTLPRAEPTLRPKIASEARVPQFPAKRHELPAEHEDEHLAPGRLVYVDGAERIDCESLVHRKTAGHVHAVQ